MFARMHTLETTSEQHDQGLAIVRDQILPWLRDSTGFRGLIRLADRKSGKVVVITLWANEEALRGSAEAGDRLGMLTVETVGSTPLALDEYEVSLFDVDAAE
jgi:heme-degrading monooxygenase HmoA